MKRGAVDITSDNLDNAGEKIIERLNKRNQDPMYLASLHKIEMSNSFKKYKLREKINQSWSLMLEEPEKFFSNPNCFDHLKLFIVHTYSNDAARRKIVETSLNYLNSKEKLDLVKHFIQYSFLPVSLVIEMFNLSQQEQFEIAKQCIPKYAGLIDFYNEELFNNEECKLLQELANQKLDEQFGTVDSTLQIIKKLITENKIGEIRSILIRLLSSKDANCKGWELQTLAKSITILFSAPNLVVEDLENLSIKLVKMHREKLIAHGFFNIDKEMHCPRPPYWGKNLHNGNDVINIRHGGGYQNILNFLAGNTKGYSLLKGGLGLQVAPSSTISPVLGSNPFTSSFYAYRSSAGFCDQPTILTAKIPAKYLDEGINSDEAGLRPQFVKYLQDIKIERLDSDLKALKWDEDGFITQILGRCKTKFN